MEPLSIYTIYDHPADYPEHYICRRFLIHQVPAGFEEETDPELIQEPTPDPDYLLQRKNLGNIRSHLSRKGLVMISGFMDGMENDPTILECWI